MIKAKVWGWMIWEALMHGSNFEPSANARMLAKQLFDMFMALKLEGFSEEQALSIVSTCIYSLTIKGE